MNTSANDESTRLSAAQLTVWRDLQLHPNDVAYSIWDSVRIGGAPDPDRLRAAIRQVCGSSPNFRLRFVGDAFDPRQVFVAATNVDVSLLDFSKHSDPQAAAMAWMLADHNVAFDPRAEVLFRNALLRVAADTILWYRNYHHLIVDGFSMIMLGRWTADAYKSLCDGSEAASQPPRTYSDYREYLRAEAEYRRSPQFEIDKRYWTSLYTELPRPVSLSVRSTRSSGDHRQVDISISWLPHELLEHCYALAGALNVSAGYLLIATVGIYIYRVTGETDIPLCMPIHGRERGPTAEMAGMCTNILPLRFRFDPEQSMSHAIAGVAAAIAQGLAHRRYRYEDLREDLGIGRGEPTPFRLHANVLRTGEPWKFTDQPVQVQALATGPIDDLSFMIVENRINRGHFRLGLTSNALLYETWEIDGHKRLFERVLKQIVTVPESRLRDLSLVTPDERSKILGEFSQGGRIECAAKCLHHLFEEQVARTPNLVAVEFEEAQLSYSELDKRANQLAHHLRNLGVVPEQIVGLCMDRSIEMIVGLLGIMKAGAAYLPLDPELPTVRITFMVKDAGARLIVTLADHELVLPDHLAQLIFLDVDGPALAEWPETPPTPILDAKQLAYVIYTSGSTGLPKGVLVQHDGLSNLVAAQRQMIAIEPGARILQFARFSFDVSVAEIALALTGGGTLIMASKTALMPGNLSKTVRDTRAEIISMPPSALPALRKSEVQCLKAIIVAGEACAVEHAREWYGLCRFINAYGPTETTVYATYAEYRGEDLMTIGKPLANLSAYVLDGSLQPVPMGVAGELCIGGIAIARGYLNRPELTRERFIADPFSNSSDARLYRTGDLARFLPDGNIEFLGRRDQQIKIRGFRIELGEIEAVLGSHEGIAESAVIVREVGKRKQLVAYVTRRTETPLSSSELRTALRGKLPDYMIPSVVVFLAELPRTASGKLDRRALPVPDMDAMERPFVEPKTQTETAFVKIWCEALSIDKVSITDNFFDVGGDSLAILNVIALAWEYLAIELPPQFVHEATDLADLALRVDELRASTGG